MNKELKEIITGIKRAIQLLDQKEKKGLAVATFIMFVTGFLTNLPALILGRLVDNLIGVSNIEFVSVAPFILFIVIVILMREALTIVRKYLIENIATHADKEQTVKVIERLLKTDIENFLYQNQIGSLHGRIFRSIQGLIKIVKLSFLEFAPIFFTAVAAIAIALYQKPIIATIMVLVIPASLYLIVKQISSQKGIRVSLLRGKEEIDGKVVEMLGGVETIRVLDTTSYEVTKIEQISERLRKIEIKHHIYMTLFDSAKYLNEGFFYILVIVLSVYFASQGIISRGDILVYSILFISIVNPLREIHRILDQAHESSIQVNDLYDLLNQPIDSSFIKEAISKGEAKKNNSVVETKNLSFSYSENEKNGILDDVNLTIKKGEWVGVVGVSGGGKTTFVHLLAELTHGYKGQIYLFGKNLSFVTREEIAEEIAYVPQKPFIFSGSIKENIIYGLKRDVDEEELIMTAKNARIYNEIEKSLGGFNGKVSENGNNLSGGQRQRIALARVMLLTPELIILDEATSALDNTNEAIIQKNIEKIFKGKTIIQIAHRLTTLKNCDRILVFDKGKIAQEGSFDKLVEEKGLFQDFLKQRAVLEK